MGQLKSNNELIDGNVFGLMRKSTAQNKKKALKNTKNVFIQFVRWSAYKLSRIVFYLFTFYFIQKK